MFWIINAVRKLAQVAFKRDVYLLKNLMICSLDACERFTLEENKLTEFDAAKYVCIDNGFLIRSKDSCSIEFQTGKSS